MRIVDWGLMIEDCWWVETWMISGLWNRWSRLGKGGGEGFCKGRGEGLRECGSECGSKGGRGGEGVSCCGG